MELVQRVQSQVFVAKQPIFNRDQQVFGYELLYRSGKGNAYDGTDGDKSTLDVIANSLMTIGLDELTNGKPGLINFTANLLLNDLASLLPKDRVIIEILEDVVPDAPILAACTALKRKGYRLAMDDVTDKMLDNPLLGLVDLVKVDFMQTPPPQRRLACQLLASPSRRMLAEKVETQEEFLQAMDDGYCYFQGYFFAKPSVHSAREIPGNKMAYMQLLQVATKPDLRYEDIEQILRQDPALTYKLLRLINSAWFGLRSEVTSIRHALILLGPREIRNWVSLVTLGDLAREKTPELILLSISRAHLCEEVGKALRMGGESSDLFLMGMFSVIDGIMDCPMDVLLEKLPLNPLIKQGLMGHDNRFRSILQTVIAYEKGEWDDFLCRAGRIGLSAPMMPDLFRTGLDRSRQTVACI